MTVHAVIPVHNNISYTLRCIEQLKQQKYPKLRLVVVNDGSDDGTSHRLKSVHPDVTVLHGDGNLWWSGAMNLGVDYVLANSRAGDFVLSLNNDVDIDDHYVQTLVDASRQHTRALVGSIGVTKDTGALIVQGQRFDWARANWFRSLSSLRHPADSTALSNLDCLDGRGLLIPIECFQKIGLFRSDVLPHYGADKEFTYRAKQAGFSLRLSLDARVTVYVTAETTGVHYSHQPTMSFAQAWQVLTSRRSTNQLQKGFRFIDLCCPPEYRLRNKIAYTKLAAARSVGRTAPGQMLSQVLRSIR